MYRSVAPRSFALSYRRMGTYEFTTNTAGNSGVNILGTKLTEFDPWVGDPPEAGPMLKFSQYFRIAKITYEFKMLHNTSAMGVTGTMPLGTKWTAAAHQTAEVPVGSGVYNTPAVESALNIYTPYPTSAQSYGLPTLYWCTPMAQNVTPAGVSDMIRAWPRVKSKMFGLNRKMSLNVRPTVYKAMETSTRFVTGPNDPTQNIEYGRTYIKSMRAPWFLSAGDGDTAVETSPALIPHGTVFIGCRGDLNTTYRFEVTKQVVIQYKGTRVTQVNNFSQVVGPEA